MVKQVVKSVANEKWAYYVGHPTDPQITIGTPGEYTIAQVPRCLTVSGRMKADAVAKRIVTAVNCHDNLVAALDKLENAVGDFLDSAALRDPSIAEAMMAARDALQEAGGA